MALLRRAGRFWAVGLIAAAACAAYSPALRNGFIGDDQVYVEGNPFVSDPAHLRYLIDPRYYLGSHEVLAGSRPVFLASLMLDRALWGGDPAGYHATNILLHAADSVWVYALSLALGLSGPLAFWAGLFFSLHPVPSEAVNVVSYRTDLLAAFFLFFSLWTYLRARGRPWRAALPLIAASAGLFGLGLLAKEMAATVPILVVLIELYFPSAPEGRGRRLAAALAAYAVAACLYAGFWTSRFHHEGAEDFSSLRPALDRAASVMPTAAGGGSLPIGLAKGHYYVPSSWEWRGLFADRKAAALTMVKAAAGYARLLALPGPLTAERAPVVVRGWGEGRVPLSLLALAMILLYAVLMRRRHPLSAFAAAWFLATLLPVCNIIPLYNPVAERYLYVVTAAAAWAAAAVIAWLACKEDARLKAAACLSGALIALAYGVRTYARAGDYENERSLYLDAAAGAPQNCRTFLVRGELLRGYHLFAEARSEYEGALRRNPGSAEAWLGLGSLAGAQGDQPRAAACYEKAVALAPRNPVMHFGYAVFLTNAKRSERAVASYRKALELEPRYAEAWVNLGALYRDQRRWAQARSCYESALRLAAPGDPVPHYSFGMLLQKMGDSEGAARAFRAALAQQGSYAPARRALARLGEKGRTRARR